LLSADVNHKNKPEMEDLQNKVREYGAKLMQGIPANVRGDGLVVSQELDVFLMRRPKIARVDIVKPSWVLESIDRKERLPLHERYVLPSRCS
jgi:hypothetical protein